MSGGHTSNPGFSSTEGIQIYTGRFSQVTYDPASSTVVIGSGLIWDTVYERLQDEDVIVLGGRETGVSELQIPWYENSQPRHVTDRCGRLGTRRRSVPVVRLSVASALTDHPQGTPSRLINMVFPSTPSLPSILFSPTARLLMSPSRHTPTCSLV